MTQPMRFAAVISAMFVLAGGATASAQTAPDARTVAARVQSFYDQTRTIQASFHQTNYNRPYGTYARSRGTLLVRKPGQMRLDYAAPNGQIYVADGRDLTWFEPGDEGSPGQYAKTPMSDDALPGAFAFLMGDARLAEEYRLRLLDPRVYHFSGHVLELVPKTADPRFRRILLYVDGDARRAGLVHAIRIDDHEGSRNKFELTGMRFDREIAASRFRFTPPRGARRIRT